MQTEAAPDLPTMQAGTAAAAGVALSDGMAGGVDGSHGPVSWPDCNLQLAYPDYDVAHLWLIVKGTWVIHADRCRLVGLNI